VASTVGLIPWKPGQAPNPRGSSAKVRRRKLLRESLDLILGSIPPEALLKHIPEDIRDALPKSFTFADLIAMRVVLVAATANEPRHVLEAGKLILGAQEKGQGVPPAHKPKPPILPSTEDRRRAIAQQLGLDIDAENDGPK
jgi:hypothetical protein